MPFVKHRGFLKPLLPTAAKDSSTEPSPGPTRTGYAKFATRTGLPEFRRKPEPPGITTGALTTAPRSARAPTPPAAAPSTSHVPLEAAASSALTTSGRARAEASDPLPVSHCVWQQAFQIQDAWAQPGHIENAVLLFSATPDHARLLRHRLDALEQRMTGQASAVVGKSPALAEAFERFRVELLTCSQMLHESEQAARSVTRMRAARVEDVPPEPTAEASCVGRFVLHETSPSAPALSEQAAGERAEDALCHVLDMTQNTFGANNKYSVARPVDDELERIMMANAEKRGNCDLLTLDAIRYLRGIGVHAVDLGLAKQI